MRRAPELTEVIHYPLTGGVCLLSLAVTVAAWTGHVNRELLVENYLVWHGQPWRLLTATLLHVNVIHLAFNLYWTWTFGTVVEKAFGPARAAGLILMLAAGSSAAEYAFSVGGVGLSGVGYGLFGFLWALERHDNRFAGVIDARTVQLFVVWFFLCIAMTVTQMMPVGNVAHGSGAVLGAIAGYVVAMRGRRRAMGLAGLAGVFAGIFVCSSALRPKVNFSEYAGWDVGRAGYEAMLAGNYDLALRYLTESTKYRGIDASCWFNLGLTRYHFGQYPGALNAYRRALELDPNSMEYRQAVEALAPYVRSVSEHADGDVGVPGT